MASALVFLVDKPLTAKGPQTYFDAEHMTSKKKAFNQNNLRELSNLEEIVSQTCNLQR